jgi:hypothetical protein
MLTITPRRLIAIGAGGLIVLIGAAAVTGIILRSLRTSNDHRQPPRSHASHAIKPTPPAPSPEWRLWLRLVPGPPDNTSAATLTAIGEVPSDLWSQPIRWLARHAAEAPFDITSNVQRTTTHGAAATYRIAPAARLVAGVRLRAVMKIDDREVASSTVTVPELEPSTAPAMRLERSARVARALGDTAALLDAGNALVGLDPQRFAGHWYRGLALEKRDELGAAERAYVKAVACLPRPGGSGLRNGHVDVQLEVFDRLREVRSRVQ